MYIRNHLNGNWVVRNNIIKSGSYANISANNNTGRLTFDHNIYPGANWGFQIGTNGMTFTTWKSNGYDTAGSSTSNPLFVNPTPSAASDFMLQGTSPAKWAGVNLGLSVLTHDYADNPVHNPPSIGAYEYNGSTTLSGLRNLRIFK